MSVGVLSMYMRIALAFYTHASYAIMVATFVAPQYALRKRLYVIATSTLSNALHRRIMTVHLTIVS